MKRDQPMTVTTRSVTLRDFFIFQLKLLLDGAKDGVVFVVSIGAVTLDFIAGRGRRPRLFYSVMKLSERFDLWLNLHGTLDRLEESGGDGLLGASDPEEDSLIGQIERLVRTREDGGSPPRRAGDAAVDPPKEP